MLETEKVNAYTDPIPDRRTSAPHSLRRPFGTARKLNTKYCSHWSWSTDSRGDLDVVPVTSRSDEALKFTARRLWETPATAGKRRPTPGRFIPPCGGPAVLLRILASLNRKRN